MAPRRADARARAVARRPRDAARSITQLGEPSARARVGAPPVGARPSAARAAEHVRRDEVPRAVGARQRRAVRDADRESRWPSSERARDAPAVHRVATGGRRATPTDHRAPAPLLEEHGGAGRHCDDALAPRPAALSALSQRSERKLDEGAWRDAEPHEHLRLSRAWSHARRSFASLEEAARAWESPDAGPGHTHGDPAPST